MTRGSDLTRTDRRPLLCCLIDPNRAAHPPNGSDSRRHTHNVTVSDGHWGFVCRAYGPDLRKHILLCVCFFSSFLLRHSCLRGSFSLPYLSCPKIQKPEYEVNGEGNIPSYEGAPTTDECYREDRWHFACNETMQLITTLPCVFNAQIHSHRWRLIMWLKGTAAACQL